MLITNAPPSATDSHFDPTSLLLFDEELDVHIPVEPDQPLAAAIKYPALHRCAPPSQATLLDILERLESARQRTTTEHIFNDLTRLLGYLGMIETDLRGDDSLREALPKFMLIEGEARALLDFIAAQVPENAELLDPFSAALDDIGYILRHESGRVFTCELVALSELQCATSMRAKIEHAHGILGNCFQQAIIALARVFDPTLDAARLFDDVQIRREQSLTLYRDLTALMQLVRRAGQGHDPSLTCQLVIDLKTFNHGSMRYLMFKDWEPFEQFVADVVETQDTSALMPVLHQFGCFLETLHAHVCMRAVLADCTADLMHTEAAAMAANASYA